MRRALFLLLVTLPAPAAADAALPWAAQTASPTPADTRGRDRIETEALARCGPADSGLDRVARALAAQKRAGAPMPSPDVIDRLQRAAGEPHPWPQAWATRFGPSAEGAAMGKLADWIATDHAQGTRRCGAGAARTPEGDVVLVVVSVDAVADLEPLPVRARTGQWLTVRAHLSSRARAAKVVVLGSGGETRTVPTTLDGGVAQARFAVDRPGELTVQVVAEMPGGPRPVLEATVFGDVEPPVDARPHAAPGESADAGWADGRDDDRLARMLLAARAQMGAPPLVRDARLDVIANAHSAAMVAKGQLAHDVGDGTPMDRVQGQGVDAAQTGENVALAATPALAHRALWDSPSHRSNSLSRQFDRVGIGVERDAAGNLWVTELFVGGRGLRR